MMQKPRAADMYYFRESCLPSDDKVEFFIKTMFFLPNIVSLINCADNLDHTPDPSMSLPRRFRFAADRAARNP